MFMKKSLLTVLLAALCLLLCACAAQRSEEELYSKLLARFNEAGYMPVVSALNDDSQVPFAGAAYWRQIDLGEEKVLVYFDESNRADYLKSFADAERFGTVVRFGQRFVLAYQGNDAVLTAFLQALDQQMP